MLIVVVTLRLNMASITSWSPRQNRKAKASRTPSFISFYCLTVGAVWPAAACPCLCFIIFIIDYVPRLRSKITSSLFLLFVTHRFSEKRENCTAHSPHRMLSCLLNFQKMIRKYLREYLTHYHIKCGISKWKGTAGSVSRAWES